MDEEPRKRRPRRDEDRDDDEPDDRPRRRSVRRRDDLDDAIRRQPRQRSLSVGQMDLRVKLVLAAVVVLLVLIGLGIFGLWYWYRTSQAAPFQPFVAQYLAAPAGAAQGRPAQGKMVVVDTAKRDVDWDIFFALPDEVRAARPQEVGTIVWTNWGKDQTGAYDDGTPAYVLWCKVTVIDRKTRTIIAESGQFRGSAPPQSIDSNSSSGSGSKPTEAVLEFLKNLPRG